MDAEAEDVSGTIQEVAVEDTAETPAPNAGDPTETVIRVLESLPPGESQRISAPETSSDESTAPTDNQPFQTDNQTFQTPETLTDLSVASANNKKLNDDLGQSVDALANENTADTSLDAVASGFGLVGASPNVVVERVGGAGTGLLSWNLTANTEDAAQAGEVTSLSLVSPSASASVGPQQLSLSEDSSLSSWVKEGPVVFPLDFGDPSAILTQDQILRIDEALKSECQNKSETGNNSLMDVPHSSSAENEDVISNVDVAGQSGVRAVEQSGIAAEQSGIAAVGDSDLGEAQADQDVSQSKLQMSTSTDSLNLEGVLDIGTTFNTKDLMNQVMSSDLLMDAIGAQGLVAEVKDARSNDDESENGSTSESTPSKKQEQKRRSVRIAHIEANDITLRQALREKEQKKKEREERKRQKKEKKVKGQGGMKSYESSPSPVEKPAVDTDISSEIAKYLQVIDLEIKKSADIEKSPSNRNEETEEIEKKTSQHEEKGKVRTNIFENIVTAKTADMIKVANKGDDEDKGKGNSKQDCKAADVKEEKGAFTDKSGSSTSEAGKVKSEKEAKEKSKLELVSDDDEPGELKDEKEVGELSDHEEGDSLGVGGCAPWMDHSYAASPKSKAQPSTSQTEKQGRDLPSARRSSRRSHGGKETEESQEENRDDRQKKSSGKESKASKKGDEEKGAKSGKRLRKKSTRDAEDKKRRNRSESADKRESSVEDSARQSKQRLSKSKDKEKDKKKDKKEKGESTEKNGKNKEKKALRLSKDGKEREGLTASKKSPRKSIRKQKHVDDAELSDIPFSSEEDDGERDAGEHDTGSDWTSDDDPEKLWCICRQPHDGKFMICCDKCEEWFHGKCVGISKKEGKRMEKEDQSWMCPNCIDGKTKQKEETTSTAKTMKDDEKKKQKQREIEEEMKAETRKEKPKHKDEKRKKDEKNKKDVEKEEQGKEKGSAKEEQGKEKGPVKKDKGEKGLEEKRRKRKSDGGQKKEAEDSGKKAKRKDEDVEDTSPPSSKKKRLKFFRPPPPKQHCIGPHCENWARSGSVYCSPACIVKHAKESVRILTAEKERAAGIKGRRDSVGGVGGSSSGPPATSMKLRDDERISVIERHTGRLRTGLTAPTYEELPYWLGRHPTYEVLRPNTKHTAALYAGGEKSSKSKSESRRLSHEGESTKHISSSDSERKVSTKQITSPNKSGKATSEDSLEKRQRERREKVRRLLEMKRREEAEAKEREAERRWMEENKRRLEEEKREEEERRRKEDKEKRREERERRERERKEKEEKARLQAESSRLAEQTSESVRVNVKRTLVDVLLTRVKKASDMKRTTADEVKQTAKKIEFELYKLFNDTGAKYKAKYRTLIFNIKDMKNKGLFRHILNGEIDPRNLVRMSSEQLASHELMKWREEEAKHEIDLIVQTEVENVAKPQHFVKKTHKGEVELGEEDNLGALVPEEPGSSKARQSPTAILTELKSPTRLVPTTPTTSHANPSPGSASSTTPTASATPIPAPMMFDTTDQHKAHLFDLSCKICTGKIPAPQEEKSSKKATVVRRTPKVSAATASKELKKKKKKKTVVSEKPVKFFGEDEPEEKKREPKRVNDDLNEDLYGDIMDMGTGVEDDDDDDDGNVIISAVEENVSTTPPGSPEPTVRIITKPQKKKAKRSSSTPAIAPTVSDAPPWRGFIFMHEVSKFVAVAHHVSGPASSIPMDLQDTLEVCGRIPYPVVWDYFTKLRQSQSTEMTVMFFQVWQPDEEPAFFALFDYFYSRRRIGVVGKNRPHIKDFYIIALPSTDKIPSQILPFDGPGLPTNRPHMLLGIVVRHKDKPRSQSLDGENVAWQPSHHKESAPQSGPRKKTIVEDITPPANPLSSFRSALPNIREISDLVDPKEPLSNVPLRTKEVYVTESQLVDPIVAQYANADPKFLEAELEEPYSPSFEERQAPYDPSDPTDDWMTGRSMPASAVIPEPAPPASTKPNSDRPTETLGGIQSSDIASAESDASQDVLSAFSDQTELSDQQQLLIQLTKQVEEAKKALLDRQIESLRTEINKATGKADSSEEQQQSDADAAATSPDVRLAPADSSTMTPKDDAPSTPGNPASSEASSEVPALVPPPELPPFAVGAVLWKAAQEVAGAAATPPQQSGQNLPLQPEAVVSSAAPPAMTQPANQQQWQAPQSSGDFQGHQYPGSHQQVAEHIPPPVPVGHERLHKQFSDPVIPQNPPGSHRPHHHSSPGPQPEPSHHHRPHGHHRRHHRRHSHPKEPPVPASSASVFPPASSGPAVPGVPGGPVIPGAPGSQPTPVEQPAPITKKRKLEPPPPGVESWAYEEDVESDTPSDTGHSKSKRQGPEESAGKRRDWDPRDVDLRVRDPEMRHGPNRAARRRNWGEEPEDRQGASWERESWHQERWEGQRHEDPGAWRRREPPRRASLEREEGYRDWPARDYDARGGVKIDYGHQKAKKTVVSDPRITRDAPPYSRDFDYRHGQR